jgi:Amt family ammonium transporter
MGAIGGVIVVFSILFFDKIKMDDPVGAISVHGICGIWGTISLVFFTTEEAGTFSLMSQLIGVGTVYIFAFGVSLVLCVLGKIIFGIRVSDEEEAEGLDVAEHGAPAYAD